MLERRESNGPDVTSAVPGSGASPADPRDPPTASHVAAGPRVALSEQLFDTGGMGAAMPMSLAHPRPVSLAHEHVLAVRDPLAPLLPGGALQRGTTVGVSGNGATSLALAMAAGPAMAGSWVASVGAVSGWSAAAEAGLPFERLVVIDDPPADRWATVVAALIGSFDVILIAPRHRVRASDARRLASRARERGTVFIQVPVHGLAGVPHAGIRCGLEVDVCLHVDQQHWAGVGDGHGHLKGCRVKVSATGRGRAAQPRHATLWLPLSCGVAGVLPIQGDRRPTC